MTREASCAASITGSRLACVRAAGRRFPDLWRVPQEWPDHSMRNLIIENDERLARVMAQVLRQERCDVDLAHDGESGLEPALTGIYDALIVA